MTITPTESSKISSQERWIALLALAAIVLNITLEFVLKVAPAYAYIPLYIAIVLGGIPLLKDLLAGILKGNFGSDILAGISIVVGCVLEQYLAATLVILMLSGGTALERFAARRASSVLDALARRLPQVAHKKGPQGLQDLSLDTIAIGDELLVLPHEHCPVDGTVIEGQGSMDEAYLTGEPFKISKSPGSQVYSGAINGTESLTIRATRQAKDSRYARIMQVVEKTEHQRVPMKRLADQLGTWYTPLALVIALLAWYYSGDPLRLLSVLVVATPCPLLIAIPITIIGSISLAAARGIIVKDPAILERIATCRTIVLDKTGTLTHGTPHLESDFYFGGNTREKIMPLVGAIERYSRHPLAAALADAALAVTAPPVNVSKVSEEPGQGLRGVVNGDEIFITSRKQLSELGQAEALKELPSAGGLECVVLFNGKLAALYRFRDEPRKDSKSFIGHLTPRHSISRILIVSGDRESEVRYLADSVGITEIHASVAPEDKVAIVKREMENAPTLFLGDGINDAPALLAATVGIAFGHSNDITTEAAGAIIMEPSLAKVDEFFHIATRMRTIALQSALGGMGLSIIGMGAAAHGLLTPVEGALLQEAIDLCAVLNALRVARKPAQLTDF